MQKSNINKPYDPKNVEPKIYELWTDSGYFNPDKLPPLPSGKPRTEIFSVSIAPPNITGSLHIGHALENIITDIAVRYYRMRGFKTLWLPGTDHAAIATQNVVEKDLKKQGLSRHDLGKEKFLEKVWEWKEKYGSIILDQLKKLGFSLDWSRTRFTMDKEYQKAVKAAFEHYKKKGLIYQGERVINWCVKDQTALSDLELEYAQEISKMWYIKYPLKDSGDFIIIATARPETMFGDTAVAVNPDDKRYIKLIGKTAVLPLVGREIPIIADKSIDMSLGTGALKVTPAHSIADSEIASKHDLPFVKIIDERGRITNTGTEFDGLKIAEARNKVEEKLKELDFLEKSEEMRHNIAKCYRCGSTIEPLLSKQWFLKVKPLAENAIEKIESEELQYIPEKWKDIALERLRSERDWCISRQIWWGHQIPGTQDTFDTWFSSALWPFATLGWPKQTKDLEEYHPNSMVTSGRDILNIWISKMIFSGIEFTGKIPFKKVVIHATVLNRDGKRMSKSLGTGLDPLDFVEKYGADATRFGLIYQAMGGQDIHFNEDVLMMGKKFCNKLWNISKYVMMKTGGKAYEISENELRKNAKEEINKTMLLKLSELKPKTSENIEGYELGHAAHELYDFIWHDFADEYIENSKQSSTEETQKTLFITLLAVLKLLHPFMPFITEEIWRNLGQKKLLIVSEWPKD